LDGERLRGLEERLAALLHDPTSAPGDPLFSSVRPDELEEAAAEVRRMVLGRTHRGTGGVREWYPLTLAAWRERHPDDGDLDALARAFCASAACATWREGTSNELGISLEESFHDFFEDAGIGDPATRDEEFLGAVFRALAITPAARFRLPSGARQAPAGCYVVSSAGILHAALTGGRYLHGALPRIAVLLLEGDSEDEVERQTASTPTGVAAVAAELRRLGLR
jgi:hypothetical protein